MNTTARRIIRRADCFESNMDLALTTRWNASRHTSGEKMIEEILALGFKHVELGYDLRLDLVPGVLKMVKERAVRVNSVHNFCPVPVTAVKGHPETYIPTDPDPRMRENAIQYTSQSLRFAAEVGAQVVVMHAGHVTMPRLSRDLYALCEAGKQSSDQYEKTKLKLQVTRDRKAQPHLDNLKSCLDRLLVVAEETGVYLALENLPTWEAVPTELEMEALCKQYGTRHLRYWHDIGHAQVRQNLGLINVERWLERLSPGLAGMPVHDVLPPAADHLMPPAGKVDFPALKRIANTRVFKVIEPSPLTPEDHILRAVAYLRQTWENTPAAESQADPQRENEQ
jgi:sugar phosphate isomerase/epimerase